MILEYDLQVLDICYDKNFFSIDIDFLNNATKNPNGIDLVEQLFSSYVN